jgi:type I restriction enzyme S subunit
LGKTAVVSEDLLPANTNQAVGIIRVNCTRADPRYVAYLLRTKHYNYTINNLVAQSAQPNVNLTELGRLRISLPSMETQRAIVRVLGALDDKIELNRKMNKTLARMARTIFKAWFVVFEPFRDKGLVDSPLGKIPKGWKVVPLGELFAVGLGGAWGEDAPSENASTAVRCLRGIDCHELAEGRTPEVPTRWLSAGQTADRTLADGGTVIVEGSGSFCGRSLLWDSSFRRVVQEPVVYSNFCKRLEPKCTASQALVAWLQMREAYRTGEMQSFRTGTAFPNFDIHGALANLLVMRPPVPVANVFAEFYNLSRRTDLMVQSRTLAAIRDVLLPKLMSGEVLPKQMESAVAETQR